MLRAEIPRRPWLLSLLALSILALGAVSFIHRVGVTEPALGVEWIQTSQGPVALGVTESGPAALAGLRAGDVLLRVDGTRLHSALDAGQIGWNAATAETIRLEVRRGVGAMTLDVVPGWQSRSEPYTYIAIVGLAFWVSGMFIAWRWPSIRGSRLYSLLALALCANFTLSHTGRADALDWSVYWADLLAEALVPALMLHLGVALSRRIVTARRTAIGLAYATSAGLVVFALWFSSIGLNGARLFAEPLAVMQGRDRAALLYFALSVVVTMFLLVKSYRKSSSLMQRGQMRWMLWGMGIGLGPFVMLYAVPWSLSAPELPIWAQFVAVAPILFLPAAFTAALARYRLHDLDLFLLRGFSEVTAVFCAFGVYAATLFLLREGLAEIVPITRGGSRYVGLLCMVVAYPQLRTWVRVGVDRAFYSKRYSYRNTLLEWARELNAETDLPMMLSRLRARVCDTLGVPRADVWIRDGHQRFRAAGGVDVFELQPDAAEQLDSGSYFHLDNRQVVRAEWARHLFSMKVKGRLSAVLVLAERQPPEEPLNSEDRVLLGTLAAHAAAAIEAARLVLEVRQRAEEIERLHARHAKILESSAVGLALLDAQGRIQAWNRALEGIYGLPRAEAIGRGLSDVFPLQVVRRIERERRQRTGSGEARIFRLSLINRRGERLVANLAISAVDRDGDEDGATVVTFDDVTERVKLEEQVLRQERLASLGLLAAGVAHEINTPLTGISSYAQLLLEETSAQDPRRALLQKIEDQTNRASQITGSLLNLARPERTSLQSLDINQTIREALQLFEPQVRGAAVELRVDLAEGLPPIDGHRGKLQQVLLNLLINARDAVSEEGRIEVRSSLVDDRIRICVSDNGVGIADEDLGSIFDPFFTTKGRGKGTGLGLSISYGIVREHAGEIHVESQPGRFTQFTIELACGEAPAVAAHLA